jgi:PAS domain S-box-containing protein
MVPASLHDVDGRFVHMNAAAERASGKWNAQMLGHHFAERLLPEEREKVTAQFRRAVEHGVPTDFETVFIDDKRASAGRPRAASASPLRRRSLRFRMVGTQARLARVPGPSMTTDIRGCSDFLKAVPPAGIEPAHAV